MQKQPPAQDEQENPPRLRTQMPPDRSLVAGFRDLAYRTALSRGFTRSGAYDWKIVTGEALVGIVLRSEKHGGKLPISMETILYPGYIEGRFRDYLPDAYRSARTVQDLSEYREGGVGLYLIAKLADYHYHNDDFEHGSELIIKMRRR